MWRVLLVVAAAGEPAAGEPATAAAEPASWASSVDWGAPLPRGVIPEDDWPWATGEDAVCGWSGATLLCDDGAGISRAYRAWEGPVEGEPYWIRCAGLEWCAGARVSRDGGDRERWRWASRAPPHRGWEGAAPSAAPSVSGEGLGVTVTLVGGEAWGEHREVLAGALAACRGAEALDEFPLAVLYDEAGPRKVRLQGFPPATVDVSCLVDAAAAAPRPADGAAVEVMLTGAVSAPR